MTLQSRPVQTAVQTGLDSVQTPVQISPDRSEYTIRKVRFWEYIPSGSRMKRFRQKRTKTWRIVTVDGGYVDSFLTKEAAERKLAQLTGVRSDG